MGPRKQADPRPPDDAAMRADEEAISWAIALREKPRDSETQHRFRQWLDAAPENADAWAEMAHLYGRLGEVEPAFAIRAADRHASPARNQLSALPFRPLAALPFAALRPGRAALPLALIACVAGLAVLCMPALSLRFHADHMTGVGEMRVVRLADGSRVELAPRSAIAVDYDAPRRQVTLLRGEAFFRVRPDRHRPFHVKSSAATITVLGTAFNVREDMSGNAFISVEHGRVRVSPSNQQDHAGILLGGETAGVNAQGALARATLPPDQVAAWRNRQLIVQNEPMSMAIDRLRPWFDGIILTHGEGLERQRLTGLFNTGDPVEALRGMARAYGGRVTTIGDWLILYSQD